MVLRSPPPRSTGGGNNTKQHLGMTFEVGNNLTRAMEENCVVCSKIVGEKDNGLQCDLCNGWYHSSCVKVNINSKYKLMSKVDIDWYCQICLTNLFV